MKILFGIVLLTIGMQPASAQAIYRCDTDVAVIYSDRACAPGAKPHEIDDSRVTVYESPPTAERAAKAASNTTRKPKTRKVTADHEQRAARCDKLNDSLRDVRTKMRTGYGVKEGERLKARQRRLTEQRRAEKCS